MIDKPTFVHRDGMTSNSDYIQWIADTKSRYRSSQIKAAIRVNTAMLEFYWGIGRDLVALKAEERWGKGIVKQFALDMRNAFPEAKGFSISNVKYMKQWYSFYYKQVTKSQQSVGQLWMDKLGHQPGGLIARQAGEKSQRLVDQLDMPAVFGQLSYLEEV